MERGDLQWPSACRTGSYRTSPGTLVQGEVRYGMAWSCLSPKEKAEGCVLPCVAYPASNEVLVDALAN